MGIKNLNSLLLKKCPDVFKGKHISEFTFKKIAVDTSLYVCKYKVIYGEEWFKNIFFLIAKLRENDIHTVFIFDTKAPPEKEMERDDRKKKQDFIKDKISNLGYAIGHYDNSGEIMPILKKYETVNLLRNTTVLDIDKARTDLEKIKRQVITKTKEDFEITKKLLDVLKVPYYDAPMEAECAAADLCKRGLIDAVLTEDTDCLTYGAPIMISKFKPSTGMYTEILHEEVINGLGVNTNEFVDLCILCGCDYNKNIPKVGPMTSYELILKHRTIDRIKNETDYNTDILNHVRSRELFRDYERLHVEKIPFCGMPDKVEVIKFLNENGIQSTDEFIEKSFIHNVVIFED